jgi:hypothetical protein
MTSIDTLVFTADRSVYAVPGYKYSSSLGPLPPFVSAQGCSPDLEYRCEEDATAKYNVCMSPIVLGYCSPSELASDTAAIGNLLCDQALAARRVCASTRDFELQACPLEYGCAPGNTCVPDVTWGWVGSPGRGICCPTGNVACGANCYPPCSLQQYFDGR